MGIHYEVFEDKLHPGDWRAEFIDHADEGLCYVTIFSGPGAQQRAEEYAAYKNGDLLLDLVRLSGDLDWLDWARAWLAGKILGRRLHRQYHRLMRGIPVPDEAYQ